MIMLIENDYTYKFLDYKKMNLSDLYRYRNHWYNQR